MARGTSLTNLLVMLKAEVGDYSGTNTATDAMLSTLLSNKQKWLATEYSWPFLEQRFDDVVPANTQFKTFPTVDQSGDTIALNLERMPVVEVLWNTIYLPLMYGIGIDEYNAMNIVFGQQSDPIQRWRFSSNVDETTGPNMFEVWPVPVTTQTVRFTGQRALQPLATGTDKADLDDMLLVYYVAGERLIRNKQADGQLKLQLAQRRLAWVRQNYPTADRKHRLGAGDMGFYRDRKLVGMTIAVR